MQASLPISRETIRLTSVRRTLAGRIALIVAATAFVAVCAQLSVPLWFTPVPLTMQNFAVLLVGLALGPADGFAAMLLYLAEGASGIPVFSPAGAAGLGHLLGPTGGFLLAYPVVAALMGFVPRVRLFATRKFAGAILAGISGTVLLFAMGAGWLAFMLHLSMTHALQMGVLPYIPGEVVKIAAAAGIYASGSALLASRS